MTDTTTFDRPADGAADVSLYRAIWRWHFFAGLLVIPFIISLAITGGLYLFKDEIDRTVFSARNVVVPGESQLAPSALVERAVAAVPGSAATAYRDPPSADRTALVKVGSEAGTTLVFVDPYRGTVAGTVGSKEEFHWVVKKIHSLEYFGGLTNRLIEAVGGFALVLVVTGFYLWWPRRQTGGVVTLRGTPKRRVFWRDLHAVTGAFAGLLIFFLAISGMPWSGYWGGQVNGLISAAGLGYPPLLWDAVPTSTKVTADVLDKSGWTVEGAPVPLSADAGAASIGIDRAVEIAKSAGIAPGFELSLPDGDTGVYTAAIFPDSLQQQRTIHIDQYSGTPIVDLKFDDYGAVAKVIEWGINVHMGQEWGLFNQILMLATILAIILSSIAAVVMWWKRRPAGRVGVPPAPPSRSVYVVLWIVAVVVGALFPMTGLAILAMVAVDQAIIRFVPALKRAFS